jgi:hypothetical protein
MSVSSTSKKVNVADGANTAAVDLRGRLQVSDADLQVLVNLANEQLRQLTKIALLLQQMSGVFVEDDDIDIPNF